MVIENLTYKYRNKIILNKVNLILNKGLYQLKGPSGSGKSTLFYLIKGILPSNIKHKYKVSLMCQEIVLKENLTIYQNLNLVSSDKQYMDFLLLKFGLKGTKKVSHLSLGEKQIVSFIQTILNKSDIYLFDEPTSNLDDSNEKKILEYLKELSLESCVIFCSHKNTSLGKIILLKEGKVYQEKEKLDLMTPKYKTKIVLICSTFFLKFFLYLLLMCGLTFLTRMGSKDNNYKYIFNDKVIETENLFTKKQKYLYNYNVKGITNNFEGVIINEIASLKFDLAKEDYIYDQSNSYQVVDIIQDKQIIPTLYFSVPGETYIEDAELNSLFITINKNTDQLINILKISIFLCFLTLLIILTEKGLKNYLLIDILGNSKCLQLTLFIETISTSLLLVFDNMLLTLNILFGLVLYFYVKRREVAILRNKP